MSVRRTLFRAHRSLGIGAGLVLAVMGATGAAMAFADEIMTAMSPGVVTLAVDSRPRLAPDALLAAAMRQRPGADVTQIVIERFPDRADRITFAAPEGKRRGEQSYVDPHDGRLLGPATGESFFRATEDLHRSLALPGEANGVGRVVTGAAAMSLIFFALSGLYLRWPRRPLDWRGWMTLDLRRGRRNAYRSLHRVVGGWLFPFYLLSALTGLWWSFDWYQTGVRHVLTGKTMAAKKAPESRGLPSPSLVPSWHSFLAMERSRFQRVTITIPRGDRPVIMRELPQGARHDRMVDEFRFPTRPGSPIEIIRYADQTMGDVIVASVRQIHTGAFFGLAGRILVLIGAASVPMAAVTGLLLHFGRRRQRS